MSDENKPEYKMILERGGILSPNLSIKATEKGVIFILNEDLAFNTLLNSENILTMLQTEFKSALMRYLKIESMREVKIDIMKEVKK